MIPRANPLSAAGNKTDGQRTHRSTQYPTSRPRGCKFNIRHYLSGTWSLSSLPQVTSGSIAGHSMPGASESKTDPPGTNAHLDSPISHHGLYPDSRGRGHLRIRLATDSAQGYIHAEVALNRPGNPARHNRISSLPEQHQRSIMRSSP